MSALAADIPVKPNTAAIIETTRKIKAHLSNDMNWVPFAANKPRTACLVPKQTIKSHGSAGQEAGRGFFALMAEVTFAA